MSTNRCTLRHSITHRNDEKSSMKPSRPTSTSVGVNASQIMTCRTRQRWMAGLNVNWPDSRRSSANYTRNTAHPNCHQSLNLGSTGTDKEQICHSVNASSTINISVEDRPRERSLL